MYIYKHVSNVGMYIFMYCDYIVVVYLIEETNKIAIVVYSQS